MSTHGLEILDKAMHTTNLWLKEIGESDGIGPDPQRSYHALRSVLQTLRDRLTVDEAAHLSAQLPLMVRGVFYEGYRPAAMPQKFRTQDEFLGKVSERAGNIGPINPKDASRAVFRVLDRHIAGPEMEKVKHALPHEVRSLFDGTQQPG